MRIRTGVAPFQPNISPSVRCFSPFDDLQRLLTCLSYLNSVSLSIALRPPLPFADLNVGRLPELLLAAAWIELSLRDRAAPETAVLG